MGSNQQNKPQATTPAPGAEGTADVNAGKVEQAAESKEQSIGTPEWVEKLLASNAEVIESNNALAASNEAVVAAVEQFKDKATDLIREVIDEAKNGQSATSTEVKTRKALPEVDADATYVVKAGRKFQDKDSHMMYHEGEDVSHFDIPRLQSLLEQGIIEEK